MRKGGKKLFNDPEKLYLLLNFRLEGYSYDSLASLFHCDSRAVRHQCEKYAISVERGDFSVQRHLSTMEDILPESSQWIVRDGERINLGRNYKDYIPLYKKRDRVEH